MQLHENSYAIKGVIQITEDNIQNLTINPTKDRGKMPWRSNPVGRIFARPLSETGGKKMSVPTGVRRDGIKYKIYFGALSGVPVSIYERII